MLGDGCFSRTLPCRLVETKQLENYLELMAANGKFLKDLRYAGMTAVFEYAEPKKYHYCIDVYYRPLKRAELQSVEFGEYQETCRACGWDYVCAYDNVVIFKSEEEERPPELQTDLQLKRESLKNVTLRAERKRMMMELGRVVLCSCPFLINMDRGLSFDKLFIETAAGSSELLVCLILPLMVVKNVYDYFALARLLKSDRPLPSKARLFDSFTFGLTMIFLFSLYCIWEGVWFMLAGTVIYSVLTCFLLAALIGFDWYQKKHKKVAAAWAMDGSSIIMGCGTLVMAVLLIATIVSLPGVGNYRFMIRHEAGYGEDYGSGFSEEVLRDSALHPEAAGLWDREDGQPESYRESEMFHKNISHYAEGENLVYVTDTNSYGDFKNLYRNLRYIGTLTVRLFDENDAGRFLRSKGLSLDGAQRLELLPEVESYLLESGKEMVHRKGNLVVIHFLNRYDERCFELTKEDVRAAVAEQLRKIMGSGAVKRASFVERKKNPGGM